MTKRKLNTFIKSRNITFGDYLLFQEYTKKEHDGTQYSYAVSKPMLVIYLGMFVCDQTIGFNYVKWINEDHTKRITNEHVTNFKVWEQVGNITCHIEWDDYCDILGHWETRPNWKEIIKSYRKMNTETIIQSDKIDWSYDEPPSKS